MLSKDLSNLAKVFEEVALRDGTLNPLAVVRRLRTMEAEAKELENSVVPKEARGVVDPRDPNVVTFTTPGKTRKI